MVSKKIPNELLFEVICFIKFQKKWAHTRVSIAFDQLLLERLGEWLQQIRASAQRCVRAARTIQRLISMISESDMQVMHQGDKVPLRCSEARRFALTLVWMVNRGNYLPNMGNIVGLPVADGAPNYWKTVPGLFGISEIGACPGALNFAHDKCSLINGMSDFWPRENDGKVNEVLNRSVQLVQICGNCEGSTIKELDWLGKCKHSKDFQFKSFAF